MIEGRISLPIETAYLKGSLKGQDLSSYRGQDLTGCCPNQPILA